MAGQDRDRAVKLLGEKHPDDLVRPCQAAEGERQVAFQQQRRIQAVGAADHERGGAGAIVAPLADIGCECLRPGGLAALVEQDQLAALAPCRADGVRFLALAGTRAGGAAFGALDQAAEFDADGRAGFGEAIHIA